MKLLGRKVSYKYMNKRFTVLWSKKGPVTMTNIGNDFFCIWFASKEDLDIALKGGSWILDDHYLAIQRW